MRTVKTLTSLLFSLILLARLKRIRAQTAPFSLFPTCL